MKTIGTILIIICFVANAFIGYVLWNLGHGWHMKEAAQSTEVNTSKEHVYDKYGFSFVAPAGYKSGTGDIEHGTIDRLYAQDGDDLMYANIEVYTGGAEAEGDIEFSNAYKEKSRIDFENRSKDLKLTYHDGGIIRLANDPRRLYYDVISENIPGNSVRTKEKMYTFYHKGQLFSILFQEDEDDFDARVGEFDEMIRTLKFF